MADPINLGTKEKKLIFLVGAVMTATIVGPHVLDAYALKYRNDKFQNKAQLEKTITKLSQDLDGIEGRKEILRRYINRYQSLIERRVISLPDTVELVKQMKAISLERKQNATQFEFGDRLIFDSGDSIYTQDSNVNIHVYPLEIQMSMLHDLDIFMFIESIEKNVPSLSFPVKCSMTLLNTEFTVTNRENMMANCQINWYSVNDPDRNLKADVAVEETAAIGS